MDTPDETNRPMIAGAPTWEATKDYHNYLHERARHQEEVRDRWFRFYLVIMAGGLALLNLMPDADGSRAAILANTLPYTGLFLSFVGTLFYLLFLSQRYNARLFFRRMLVIEELTILRMLPPAEAKLIRNPLPKNPSLTADTAVMVLYGGINSIVLGISIYFTAIEYFGNSAALIDGAAFALLSVFLHLVAADRLNRVLDS